MRLSHKIFLNKAFTIRVLLLPFPNKAGIYQSFGSGVGIDVLWDFLYRPLGDEAFNWYVGAEGFGLNIRWVFGSASN